ncbi:tumor protein p53-inducible nuclear protein 1 [Salvelinus sp. IW2-2015]|uniref:tumor protein p53-inducible nuclear protein 1 n=1 Tax=Salvelinus sp. IW2-2015 TaxID=2691554 RepID=UPI000CDFED8F|nr:tumor protein p53-inducible nuclear protein 1 [Salvelinus alpinus]
MFQRLTSVLFGDDVEEVSGGGPGEQGFGQKEEDEEWILVDYLAEACSSPCGDGLSEVDLTSEEEEDLVFVPSPIASSPIRYASCSSLDSTSDTEDGGPEEEEEEEEGGFQCLEACSLEESWFVTPPPCFSGGRRGKPMVLETSPLENLLIEHPSMSVYTTHCPPRLSLNLPLSLNLNLCLPLVDAPAAVVKEPGRRSLDTPCHRPETVVQRRAGLHAGCYAAAVSARASGLLDQAQHHGRLTQRVRGAAQHQLLSRNALRRLNLLRTGGPKQAKTTTTYLHQPGQRHLNY